MITGRAAGHQPPRPDCTRQLAAVLALCLCACSRATFAESGSGELPSLIVTQLPKDTSRSLAGRLDTPLRTGCGDRARLVLVSPDGGTRELTRDFHSACDPSMSFDGRRLLFAGRQRAGDDWNIYEMNVDGTGIRQITRDLGDCRSPSYQATLYTIVSPSPWYQITFVSSGDGALNEFGDVPATHLYSCKLDGGSVRRLTYNLSSDFDPWMMDDGRVIFSAWLRCSLERGLRGRVSLFGLNIDGTDYAAYCSIDDGKRIKHMACATPSGMVVFVEADEVPWDGAGQLGRVLIRRPLHTYAPLTDSDEVVYHSPSPLPDGRLLVSRRAANDAGIHGVWWIDPSTGQEQPVFDDPEFHDIQATAVVTRDEPDGRSSVVTEEDPNAELYCLDVYNTDLPRSESFPPGIAKRIRVLEGIPRLADPQARASRTSSPDSGSRVRIPQISLRRILGEADVASDGSFHLKVPANTPYQLQLIDDEGKALRSCGWIWAKNHEPRGCIGCHEDGELTPENVLREALANPAAELCKPAAERRTVDFRRDVVPIVESKCAPCHGPGQALPDLSPQEVQDRQRPDAYAHRLYQALMQPDDSPDGDSAFGRYVHSGRARTSPVVWHIFGRNTSRSWDGPALGAPVKKIPSEPAIEITDQERGILVEWIDLGARWAGTVAETQ